jgi:hypothetical protein
MLRKTIAPELKNKLLSETIYRCGYCLKNIEKEKFEIAHIVPCIDGGEEVYENLMVLCSGSELEKKSGCHYKWDFGREIVPLVKRERNGEILSEAEIKKKRLWESLFRNLKNEWMFASGKYSRIELDLLFDLYSVVKGSTGSVFMLPNGISLIGSPRPSLKILKPWLSEDHFVDHDTKTPAGYFIRQEVYNGVTLFLRNIIESEFVFFQKNMVTSSGAITFRANLLPGHVFLTEKGYEFCRKFLKHQDRSPIK